MARKNEPLTLFIITPFGLTWFNPFLILLTKRSCGIFIDSVFRV